MKKLIHQTSAGEDSGTTVIVVGATTVNVSAEFNFCSHLWCKI